MHNWRFLLLAFIAVFKPIASYTERGLVDGRQQLCDYRTASVLRDPGLYFHGTHRFSKPAVEDRRLNQRVDVREIRRNEVREESFRRISSSDRRLVDTLERGVSSPTRLGRFSPTEARLARDGVILRRETRGLRLGDSRKERNQEVRAERPSSIYGSHRARLDSRQSSNRLSEDATRSQIRIDNRISMELRRDTRENRDNTQIQRAQETREIRIVSDRARDDITSSGRVDRRIARERAQRMDMKRSESNLQVNRNANHGILDQRFRKRELTSSSVSSARLNRAHNNDKSRIATRATQSLDRDQRRSTQFRQSIDEQQRDIYRSRVTINRDSVSSDQTNIRQASDRTEKRTTLQSDRTAESRRDVSRTEIRSLARDRSVENLHAARDTRRTKEMRLVENRVPQNSRRDSRILERERSVENPRYLRDTQNMERNLRSLEHVAETRRYDRSADRDRVSGNRREIRNIARESRTMMMDRAGIKNRDVRTFVSDLKRSTEVRRKANKNDRDSCSINREQSTDRQLAKRDFERVTVARALSADRSAENHRNTRHFVRDYRTAGLERATDNQRYTRNVERQSRELERNRIAERNTRMNLRDLRSIENEQSQASPRDSRNIISRTVRVEHNNRRDIQNIEEQALSVERAVNHRRDTRGNERDERNIRLNRISEARESRNIHREYRARATSLESRRDIRNVERQSQTIREERIITHRRAISSIEREVRSVRGERLTNSRKDLRKVDRDSRMFGPERLAENRRERAPENRRDISNVVKDARTIRTEEARRVESRITSAANSRNNRMAERLNMRDTEHDRRSRSVQRESRAETRRTFKTNNEDLERREVELSARKREFLSMNRNLIQGENDAPTMNWQYIFYTIQGLYICGVLTQLMNERSAVKKTRVSWWSAPQPLIKVD